MEELRENLGNIDIASTPLSHEELLQILAEKIKQLAEKDKRLAEKDERLAEKDELLGVGLLCKKGLPPLGIHTGSNNQTPHYGIHSPYSKPVQATPGNFAVLDDYKLNDVPHNLQSTIWRIYRQIL
jgi:hypothetical protein